MLSILCWIVYGLVVGTLAKLLDFGPHPTKLSSTIVIGIVGSYVGGLINFIFGAAPPFSRSGIIMGTIGALVFCFLYRNFELSRYIKLEMKKSKMLEDKLIEKLEAKDPE